MAEKLQTFDFGRASALTTSEKATYPWDEWLDGDIWQLTEGEDFHTHPLMMERIIRTRATGRGAKVRLRHLPRPGNGKDPFGLIVVQRHDIVGPAEQEAAEAARQAKRDENRAKRQAKKAAGREGRSGDAGKGRYQGQDHPQGQVPHQASRQDAEQAPGQEGRRLRLTHRHIAQPPGLAPSISGGCATSQRCHKSRTRRMRPVTRRFPRPAGALGASCGSLSTPHPQGWGYQPPWRGDGRCWGASSPGARP